MSESERESGASSADCRGDARKEEGLPVLLRRSFHNFYTAVLWAVEQGITAGVSEDSFAPSATVTRGQTVTFLYRAAGSPAVTEGGSFADVEDGAWYADAVAWAAAQGITAGVSADAFGPNASCTRAQIVTFLYRFMEE